MDPSKYIELKNIVPSVSGATKSEVIGALIDHLVKSGTLQSENREEILKELLDREAKGSTGIGHEIAIPHAKSDLIPEIAVAFGTYPSGVAFDSFDKKPVKIIILTLSSKKPTGPHLQFLATICNLLKDEDMRKRIIAGLTPDEIHSIIQNPK
jgi:mannitol/fructose-specific phosphotransferase system IIA component (Ntr-type)